MAKLTGIFTRIPRLWPRSLSGRLGAIAAIVLALLALTAITLRALAATDLGRDTITSLIDGRRAGPLGTIRLTGLAGDPLSNATVEDLAFVDDNGAWLRASDAEISWSPLSLLFRRIDIDRLNIETVHVFRQPSVTRPPSAGGGAPDLALRLGEATIGEIRLDDGVYGAQASYTLSLATNIERNRSGDLDLQLAPKDDSGDQLSARAAWTPLRLNHADITAEGQPGGALATLLQSPTGAPVRLDIATTEADVGVAAEAALSFGETRVAEFALNRHTQSNAVSGYVDLEQWPLFADLRQRLGHRLDISASINDARPANAPFALALTAANGTVTAQGELNLNRRTLNAPTQLNFRDLNLAAQSEAISSGRLAGEGVLDLSSLTDWQWNGVLEATDLIITQTQTRQARATASISSADSAIAFQTEDLNAAGFVIPAIPGMEPTNLTASTQGQFNWSERALTINDTTLDSPIGVTTLRGEYAMATGALSFFGETRAAQLSSLSNFSGTASSTWSANRATRDAPYRLSIDGAATSLQSPNATLAALLGPAPTLAASALWHNGRLTIENASLQTETVLLNIDGETSPAGELSGTIFGEVRDPLSLPGAQITALQIDGALSGTTTTPSAILDLSQGAVRIAGIDLSDLAGKTTLTLNDGLITETSLAATADETPVNASFALSATPRTQTISNIQLAAGNLNFASPIITLDQGIPTGAFTLAGSLAGIGGFEAGNLDLTGDFSSTGASPEITLSGDASNLRHPNLDLRRASIDGMLDGETLQVTASLQGRASGGPSLQAAASGQRSADGWSGDLVLGGESGGYPISMPTPALWSINPDGYTLSGSANLFAGSVTTDLESSSASQTLALNLSGIDVRAVTRLLQLSPLVGELDGAIQLSASADAPRTGQIQLALRGLNPLSASIDPIDLDLIGELRGATLNLTTNGNGDDHNIVAQAQIRTAGTGLILTPDLDAPMTASLDLDVRAEQLWALTRQSNQALAGAFSFNASASGSLRSPSLNGRFALREGVYEHGESGFHLEDLQLEGVLDQRSARLTTIEGVDGRGGSITGAGRLNWPDQLSGGLEFRATQLHALARDDRTAVVSGNGAVTLQPNATLISGDFTIANARFSVEQPAAEKLATLPSVRRINFPGREDTQTTQRARRPIRLEVSVDAPRRIFIYGRGLDMEWAADLDVSGTIDNPVVDGEANLVRGDLNLAGRQFPFDQGAITLNGPIRNARIDITATGAASESQARIRLSGTPVDPHFDLESSPAQPQDEILSKLIFGRSAAELSALETAQLAAALTQLAGGQAAFDPSQILRDAFGVDRISITAEGDTATLAAGQYIAEDVYLQIGAGGEGGAAAEVEWEPADNISVISSARSNGDTRMTVRWKKDY